MAEDPKPAGTPKSPEQLILEKQAALAKLNMEIAQSDLSAAKAKKEAVDLNAPQSLKDQTEAEKFIAQGQKDIFLAQKEMVKGPDITVPTGKITAEGAFIETIILSRKTLKAAMLDLFADMAKEEGFRNIDVTLIVYNASDLPAMEMYSSLRIALDSLSKAYDSSLKKAEDRLSETRVESLVPGNAMLLGYAATGLVRLAADLVSLFRTSTAIKNEDLTISETTLVAAIKGCLPRGSRKWKVFAPALYPVNILYDANATSEFQAELGKLHDRSTRATNLLTRVTAKQVNYAKLLEGKPEETLVKSVQKEIEDLELIAALLTTVNTAFEKMQAALSMPDEKTGATLAAAMFKAERLVVKLKAANTYVIKVEATSKGSNKISENLWRNASIEHSAGTELSCLVFGKDGEVKYSFQHLEYLPYQKSEKITGNMINGKENTLNTEGD